MAENFKILQKTYDMILYGNCCLKQFPRSEKYALAADIKKSMYKLLRLLIETNKKYYKKTTLKQIDVELEILRFYIRLAADPQSKYLAIRKYENWAKMLNEIGRMFGGWLKSVKH